MILITSSFSILECALHFNHCYAIVEQKSRGLLFDDRYGHQNVMIMESYTLTVKFL